MSILVNVGGLHSRQRYVGVTIPLVIYCPVVVAVVVVVVVVVVGLGGVVSMRVEIVDDGVLICIDCKDGLISFTLNDMGVT